ncbi:MAG: proline iminopeptidase-family hydrolase [Caldilineaceae bacterium]
MQNQISSQEGHISVTGGRVWYRVVGGGNAIPLLVLHGGPGVPHDYLEPLAALADERPVIFYDQLGCGKSDRPDDLSLWHIERFVEELGQVRQALGLERIHLLGHSWGGWLATEYMLTRPVGIVSLVMASSNFSLPRYQAVARRAIAALPPEIQSVIHQHEAAGTTDSVAYQQAVEEVTQHFLCLLQPYPEPLRRAGAGMGMDVYVTMQGPNEFTVTGNLKDWERTESAHEIATPTLFTYGRHEPMYDEAQYSHGLLPGAETVVFEQSAHMAHLEETERYLQVLREFLARAENRFTAQPVVDGGSQ